MGKLYRKYYDITSNLILLHLFSMCFQYNPNKLHNKNLLKSTSLEPMTDFKQQAMIRIPSKLTDELVTVDSPRRQSKIFSNSMYNTVQFRKTSSTNRHSILGKVQSVWFQSASSIVFFSLFEEKIKKSRLQVSSSPKIFIA